MPRKSIYMLAAAAFIIAVIFALGSGHEKIAEWYYTNSTFVSGGGPKYAVVLKYENGTYVKAGEYGEPPRGMRYLGRGSERPAKRVEIPESRVRDVVNRAGVKGKILGTYRFNGTHVVTLVEEEPLKMWAIIWNNKSLYTKALQFEKYLEEEYVEVAEREGDITFTRGWRIVGYVEASGILPFSTYTFYDESSGQFNASLGYFKVATAGWFTIVYGAAVYVEDRSYYELTDPMLRLCFFNTQTSGSGSILASVRANGRAITITCGLLGTVFDIIAYIGYDAFLYRHAAAHGNKWFTSGCVC